MTAPNRPVLAYIAGKYRGKTAWDVEQNIRQAEQLGFGVTEWFIPVIVHSMFRYFNGTQTDEFWLEGTLEIMRRCDIVVLCSNWETSAGSRAEKAEAERLGMPVLIAQRGSDGADWVHERELRRAWDLVLAKRET